VETTAGASGRLPRIVHQRSAEEKPVKIKSQKDFWSGLMFLLVGVVFAAEALNYTFGSSARPGPGYFPFGLGVLTAVLGAIVLFKSLTVEVESDERIGPWSWKPLLIIIAAVALFGWGIPHLGMFIALPMLIIGSALAGSEFHWKDALINCVVLTAGSWAIFIWGLNLTIPLWPTFLGG
jgi:hypothetical protein